ncbi:DUF2306 domain-containing protein [Arthrobacter cryoconiti]|uniref:DUF2306 domain-containing protein n=1 Tax=Arthrobacter cryoconiti TaxID=748907 RepID=A0ABV8QZ50_9MICC|nr:DUF2306 domain-containing protein [Arthrobacter cryoconiti]MCC9068202.1 DUF2306 domain-containing protein [Arthrobacter cryoconiti]
MDQISTKQSGPRRRTSRRTRIGLIVMALLALATAIYAVPRYLTGNPNDSVIPLNTDVALHYLTLAIHAVPAGLALVLGPIQFITPLRTRFPRAHRITGRIYMISVVFAAIAAIVATGLSVDGFSAQVAFALLGVAWLYTVVQGYRTIRRGEVQLHRVWMVRNYALTFSAVTLRIFLVSGLALRPVLGIEFAEVYSASVWAAIFINVVIAEYFFVQRITAPALRRRRRVSTNQSPKSPATSSQAPTPDPELAGQR